MNVFIKLHNHGSERCECCPLHGKTPQAATWNICSDGAIVHKYFCDSCFKRMQKAITMHNRRVSGQR